MPWWAKRLLMHTDFFSYWIAVRCNCVRVSLCVCKRLCVCVCVYVSFCFCLSVSEATARCLSASFVLVLSVSMCIYLSCARWCLWRCVFLYPYWHSFRLSTIFHSFAARRISQTISPSLQRCLQISIYSEASSQASPLDSNSTVELSLLHHQLICWDVIVMKMQIKLVWSLKCKLSLLCFHERADLRCIIMNSIVEAWVS